MTRFGLQVNLYLYFLKQLKNDQMVGLKNLIVSNEETQDFFFKDIKWFHSYLHVVTRTQDLDLGDQMKKPKTFRFFSFSFQTADFYCPFFPPILIHTISLLIIILDFFHPNIKNKKYFPFCSFNCSRRNIFLPYNGKLVGQ